MALLAALIINRSGGVGGSLGKGGEPVEVRDFMWNPPPPPEEEEFTLDMARRIATRKAPPVKK